LPRFEPSFFHELGKLFAVKAEQHTQPVGLRIGLGLEHSAAGLKVCDVAGWVDQIKMAASR